MEEDRALGQQPWRSPGMHFLLRPLPALGSQGRSCQPGTPRLQPGPGTLQCLRALGEGVDVGVWAQPGLHVLTPRLVCSWVWYVLVVWLVGVKVTSVCCVALHV